MECHKFVQEKQEYLSVLIKIKIVLINFL